MHKFLRPLGAGGVLALALALTACGNSNSGGAGGGASSTGGFAPGKPVAGQKRGGDLTVLASGDVDNIDPGQAYYSFTYQVTYATQRPLFAFKPTDTSKASPDLAAGPPQILDGGRRVIVKIKPNIRYSPPYGKTVTSADVKYAIERAFTSSVPNGYVNSYFGALQGVKAFQDKKADGIAGIKTPDPQTIEFDVTSGDIVGALSLPVTAPVPEAYAAKFDKAAQSKYGMNQLATGPYMIDSYQPGKRIRLVRNPNWSASTDFRPAYLDTITFDEGNNDTTVATRRILNGKGLVSGDFSAPPNVLKPLVQGPQKAQLILAPGAGMRYVGLNTTVKPFDDANVRKAFAAALNRTAMQTTRGGRFIGDVATHFIYPTVDGFEQAGGFPGPPVDFMRNPNGDMALATQYMKRAGYPSGKYTGGERLLVVGVNEGVAQRNAEVAQQALQSLGFKLNFRLVSQDSMYTKFCQVPKAKVAVCPNLGWIKDYADPRTIIDPLFNPKNIVPSGNVNFSQYRDPQIAAAIDAAVKMPAGPQRVQAFADVDRQLVQQAVSVPYLWDRYPVTRSANVQMVNQIWNQGGVDPSFTSLK